MKKSLVMFSLLLLVSSCYAQTYNEVLVHMTEMLQYERQKQRMAEQGRLDDFRAQPFKRMGFHRIRAKTLLSQDPHRHIWGYHVDGNREYDQSTQPLYKLFRRVDWGSMVVVDHFSEDDISCELIFWGKKYYRRFSAELRRMGFVIHTSSAQTNVLEFRKEETTVKVDVTVLPEIYMMKIF